METLISSAILKPLVPYDPRVRHWYTSAINQDKAIISEPYVTSVTKDLVVSIDKRVVSNGKKVGVVSLSIGLNNIMKNINQLHYGKTGYIYILSPNNVFINSPNKEGWLLKSDKDLQLKIFESVDQYNGKSFVKRLISGNCDAIQGYYFSEPLEVEDVENSYDRIYSV